MRRWPRFASRFGGGGAKLVDGMALFRRDLVLGHALTALDESFGIILRLRDDGLGLVTGALDDGRGFLVRSLRLGLIFGLQRLGVLAQRFGLGELVADHVDLAVQRLADRRRNLLPDDDAQ